MEQIKTFVFFDVETTGLGINECSPTQFTELAFVAVMRDHLMAANKNTIPRALFKLVLPVNPRKLILPETTRITGKFHNTSKLLVLILCGASHPLFCAYSTTNFIHELCFCSASPFILKGLDNFMLEHMNKCDDKTFDMINGFLEQLVGPVCLIAHNGNNFDFKLLKRSLNRHVSACTIKILSSHHRNLFAYRTNEILNNLQEKSLRSDLLYADSLEIFKQIEDDTSTGVLEANLDMAQIQKRNETTPSKFKYNRPRRLCIDKPSAARRLFPDENLIAIPDLTCRPADERARNTEMPSSPYTTRRTTADSARKNPPSTPTRTKTSFKLIHIFERLHGKEPDIAHTAEDDAITLLKCAIASKEKFVQTADQLSHLFASYS